MVCQRCAKGFRRRHPKFPKLHSFGTRCSRQTHTELGVWPYEVDLLLHPRGRVIVAMCRGRIDDQVRAPQGLLLHFSLASEQEGFVT